MSEWVSQRKRYVCVSREALCRLISVAVMVLDISCQERGAQAVCLGTVGYWEGCYGLHTALTACYAWLLSS